MGSTSIRSSPGWPSRLSVSRSPRRSRSGSCLSGPIDNLRGTEAPPPADAGAQERTRRRRCRALRRPAYRPLPREGCLIARKAGNLRRPHSHSNRCQRISRPGPIDRPDPCDRTSGPAPPCLRFFNPLPSAGPEGPLPRSRDHFLPKKMVICFLEILCHISSGGVRKERSFSIRSIVQSLTWNRDHLTRHQASVNGAGERGPGWASSRSRKRFHEADERTQGCQNGSRHPDGPRMRFRANEPISARTTVVRWVLGDDNRRTNPMSHWSRRDSRERTQRTRYRRRFGPRERTQRVPAAGPDRANEPNERPLPVRIARTNPTGPQP